MKEVLTLKKPLLINGKEVTELEYDFEEIDGDLWEEAARRSQKKDNYNIATFDYVFHRNLAYAAIVAVNREIAWEDLERIKGLDLQIVANLGATFMSDSMVALNQETSVEPTDNTAKPSTRPSETSEK